MTVTGSVEGRNWGGASEDKALSQSVLDTPTQKFSAPPPTFHGWEILFLEEPKRAPVPILGVENPSSFLEDQPDRRTGMPHGDRNIHVIDIWGNGPEASSSGLILFKGSTEDNPLINRDSSQASIAFLLNMKEGQRSADG